MTPADYYLISLLSFIALLLIAILGVLYRQGRSIGRLEGLINGLNDRITGLNDRVSGLESRVERLEEQMSALREQVAEIRGLLMSLNNRVDLLMRHRHDDAGRVVITPEEVAAN
ncbi:MAG: hypothetical protein J4G13_13710 [Dehalococcoidia bacterium]|nr:hypothetical protein [Dehalococcoidia bacterium]